MFSKVITQLNTWAAAISIRTIAEFFAARIKDGPRDLKSNSRYTNLPKTMDIKHASAADSVGVARPPKILPTTTTGISKAGRPSITALTRSRELSLSVFG